MIGAGGRSASTVSLRGVAPWLAIVTIVALAVALRAEALGSRLSIDDAYSWFTATSPTAHAFLSRLADNENTPPLIYLVTMLVPSDAPAWLRIPAAVPGVLLCLAVCVVTRPRFGRDAGLIAALAVAVAPYLVTYSNLARGFMLADLALIVAVGAVLSLAEHATPAGWATFVAAGVIAVWTEYGSIIVVIALVLTAVWLGVPDRRRLIAAGVLVLASLAPWIGQIVRAQDQVGVTKFDPLSATPSLTALRELAVTLTLGERGGTANPAGRWLEFVVVVGLAGLAAVALRRRATVSDEGFRRTAGLLAGTVLLTVVGYALAAVVGIDIFTQRYLTVLVPLAAMLAGGALAALADRRAIAVGMVLLVALGAIGAARRLGAQYQPDLAPIRAAALALHPRTVLTNTPVVLYYLPALHPVFDRPYNLGPGAVACARPCLAIDDTRVHGGTPRMITGAQRAIGPYTLTLEP